VLGEGFSSGTSNRGKCSREGSKNTKNFGKTYIRVLKVSKDAVKVLTGLTSRATHHKSAGICGFSQHRRDATEKESSHRAKGSLQAEAILGKRSTRSTKKNL